jgi:hypothetical protein
VITGGNGFIKESKSYDEINPDLAYRAGMALAIFRKMLADLPVVNPCSRPFPTSIIWKLV